MDGYVPIHILVDLTADFQVNDIVARQIGIYGIAGSGVTACAIVGKPLVDPMTGKVNTVTFAGFV